MTGGKPALPPDYCGPATPDSPCELSGLGCSEFARHYYRNHGCFLFLRVLRWFTSPSSLRPAMYSPEDKWCSHHLGSPIRKSPDQSSLGSSPRHIAACRVLRRLLAPRHPPCALTCLTKTVDPFRCRHRYGITVRSLHSAWFSQRRSNESPSLEHLPFGQMFG